MSLRVFLIAALWLSGISAAEHPKVYLTRQDILRAKENARRFAWARNVSDGIIRRADAWLTRSDAWLRSVVPPAGASFAYGFSGCPICSAGWGTWGGARASFDDPGHVVCVKGHRLPDRDHPDSGVGYKAPDGRVHYFVGSYNAWAVETLTFQAIDNLAYAYSLTGDERYAEKAGVILDALAAVYPECDKGSWDYPSNPPSGRFNRPWYQVARVLVHYVDFSDQVWNSRSLEAPSIKPGFNRRRNIEENLLRNAAEYCRRESLKGSLTNGEADYLRGVLSVGALLEVPDYVSWAVDGPYGIRTLLDNNVDRDGGYYETSSGYANHTRELYFTFAEPLLNYRAKPYPEGLSLYTDPKLRAFFELHNLRQSCAGHTPEYGDGHPDTSRIAAPERPFDRDDYTFLERLYARTGDPAEAQKLGSLLVWLGGGTLDNLRGAGDLNEITMGGGFQAQRWLLFHGGDVAGIKPALAPELAKSLFRSNVMGQKGLAILRQGSGADAQALLLRFGPSLNHGHLDDLNINYFALGYELTYDLGYGLGSTHTQVGWAKQTASHNVVVVDEQSQLTTGASGGSIRLFADLPALKLVEASSEASYAARSVSLYQRTLALIGAGAHTYLIDLFRIKGGHQHDYSFHAPGTEVHFGGVTLGAEEPGSLAGPDISWGSKQLNDGDIAGVPGRPYWNPPPGNGYGFLIRPRHAITSDAWSADWKIGPDAHVRLHMAGSPENEVITATAPGITPSQPAARYVLARRRVNGLTSEFLAAIEPYSVDPFLDRVERLPLSGPAAGAPAIAMRVIHTDGTADYVYSSPDASPRRSGGLLFAGRFACVTVREGKAVAASLVGGTEFSGFGMHLKPVRESWRGSITAVDPEHNTVTTPARLPGEGLAGQVVIFSNPLYSRTTAYRIRMVEPLKDGTRIHLEQSVRLGRGQVGRVVDAHTITSSIPHSYAFSATQTGASGFFQGKRIRSQSGTQAVITGMQGGREFSIILDRTDGLRPGEQFFYDDLQPGDGFEILNTLTQ